MTAIQSAHQALDALTNLAAECPPDQRARLLARVEVARREVGRVVSAEREACAMLADAESEAPGDMPDDLWAVTQTREGAAELMRAAIRATKAGIAAAIRGRA